MSTVLSIVPVAGQQGLDATGYDEPQLLDDDNFDIASNTWGGGEIRFQHLKTAQGEIVTPLAPNARTLEISGEYHAANHVVDGVFRYPFSRLERWKLSKYKVILEWPGANRPWAVEVLHRGESNPINPGIAPIVSVTTVGPESLQWYLQSISPTFEEFFASTPQVVQFSIKLREAKDGLR